LIVPAAKSSASLAILACTRAKYSSAPPWGTTWGVVLVLAGVAAGVGAGGGAAAGLAIPLFL